MPEIREAVASIEGLDLLIESLAEIVAKRMEPLQAKIQELESKLNEKSQVGPQGEQGPKGETGERGEKGDPGEKGESGPGGERGDKGDPGLPGERGERGLQGEVGAQGERGEAGLAGEMGKTGTPGEKGERGEKGLDGKDGRDGRDGINGKDGRDALHIDILPAIDETKNYPRGTFARFKGGLLRAYRDTIPMDGNLERSGWEVIVDGLAEIQRIRPDKRTLIDKFIRTSGKSDEFCEKRPIMLFADTYRSGQSYDEGDIVNWHGSAWHCQKDSVRSQPGQPGTENDWKLMVREGRPGKSAEEKKPTTKEPIRLA